MVLDIAFREHRQPAEKELIGIRMRPVRFFVPNKSQGTAYIKLGAGALLAMAILIAGGSVLPVRISWQFSRADESVAPLVFPQNDIQGQLPVVEAVAKRYILIDLARQRMEAYENGGRVMEAVISSGSRLTPTPRGTFSVLNKSPRAFSKVAQMWLPYWMAFTRDRGYWLGFHDLPEYADGGKEGLEHLGKPYSGGCIRLNTNEARALYEWAQIGDKVLVI